jgi:hypothetical protein
MASKGLQDMDARRAFRREFLALVARRQRPGAGSMLTALDVRRIFMDWWADVEQALRAIPYAVAGAVATNAYAPERTTQDIDVVVLTATAAEAETALRGAGWRRVGSLSLIEGSSWKDPDGHDLDLIALSAPWAGEAIEAARDNRIVGMPTLPLPYLVFMKLEAARTADLTDVSRMLGRADDNQVEEARQVVRRFGNAADLADFEQLVRMGRLERERGQGGAESEPPDDRSI